VIRIVIHIKYRNTYRLWKKCIVTPLPNITNFEPSFLWLKALWMVSFKRVFNLSCGRVVYRVEKSSFDGGYPRERSWFKVIQKIFRVFQNPHVIYATTRVNSFTIFLLSLFYCRQNLWQVNRQFFRRTSWWSRYVPFFGV
jgi:hypothetical protein